MPALAHEDARKIYGLSRRRPVFRPAVWTGEQPPLLRCSDSVGGTRLTLSALSAGRTFCLHSPDPSFSVIASRTFLADISGDDSHVRAELLAQLVRRWSL